jgi:drug/metabolite transporter (DMT)-like permease
MKFRLNKWLILGLASELLVAPNSAIMKHTLSTMNVPYFTFLRYLIVLIMCSPLLIKLIKKGQLKGQAAKYLWGSSVALSFAILTFTYALTMTEASYATILGLAGPIVFIPLSVRMEKEKISRRSVAGLSLAAAGAFTVVALPIALAQNATLEIRPFASLLLILNLVSWSLFIIFYRKANEQGVPMNGIMGINAVFNVVVFGFIFVTTSYYSNGNVDLSVNRSQIIAVVFSAVMVTFFSRKWKVTVYEKIGSVGSSGLDYLGSLLSIIVSILFLDEKLSVGIVIGGVLIILGLYISEHHKLSNSDHVGILKHH